MNENMGPLQHQMSCGKKSKVNGSEAYPGICVDLRRYRLFCVDIVADYVRVFELSTSYFLMSILVSMKI